MVRPDPTARSLSVSTRVLWDATARSSSVLTRGKDGPVMR